MNCYVIGFLKIWNNNIASVQLGLYTLRVCEKILQETLLTLYKNALFTSVH